MAKYEYYYDNRILSRNTRQEITSALKRMFSITCKHE